MVKLIYGVRSQNGVTSWGPGLHGTLYLLSGNYTDIYIYENILSYF